MATAVFSILTRNLAPTLTGLIIGQVARTVTQSPDTTTPEELNKLRIDTEREELEMRKAEAQAKVAQELAIARRIEEADEVQLGEYYEYVGEGGLGLKGDGKAFTAGLNASGRRISKRVYKFSGRQNSIIDASFVAASSELGNELLSE